LARERERESYRGEALALMEEREKSRSPFGEEGLSYL
jgi:hypothetical protein